MANKKKKKKRKKGKKREKPPKQQKKKKMLVVMDLFQTAVSAEFTMLNVLPFRKELLSSKAEELLFSFCLFFFKYMLTTSLSSGK